MRSAKNIVAGELKVMLSMVTGLEPREQRLLFRGKEREDSDHLHMVGVRDRDKVLLLLIGDFTVVNQY